MEPTSEAYYSYDAAGNRTSMTTDWGIINYTYDAFGRKVYREETYYKLEKQDSPGKSEFAPGQLKKEEKQNSNNGQGNAYAYGQEKQDPLK